MRGRAPRWHDAASAVGTVVQLARRHCLFDDGEQSGVGRISYCLHGVRVERERGARLRLRSSRRKVSTSRRTSAPAFSDCARISGRLPRDELRGLVPDRVVAHGRIQIVELGGEPALQLLALHVDVARFDVADVGEPAALRPAVERHQNDGDHRADDGQRRLPDSGLGLPIGYGS
jgi:hypothetical protein